MTERVTRPTNCSFCGYLCALTAVVEDERIVDIVPDETRFPYDSSVQHGCARWRMNIPQLYDPRRVNVPLRRVGERGSARFEEVTWDEALDDIATRLTELIEQHGPGTVASAIGGPHTTFWPLHRFMNLIGSPNNMGIGQICWNPRIWMDTITFGWTIEADIRSDITEALLLWGTNPSRSDNSLFWRSIVELAATDIPIVVIDPRYTRTAAKAGIWVPIRPGTDCVFALGLIHEVIAQDLVDRPFVERWTTGFDELEAHVASYAPEFVARICGIDSAQVTEVARIFGEARAAALISGRGIDQIGPDVSPTHRAICCLRAITGNVDTAGSCLMTDMSDFIPEVDLELSSVGREAREAACLNTGLTPLQSYVGYDLVTSHTMKLGRRLPERYMTSAHPDLVLDAMVMGVPYPVRALLLDATNPLVTYADTHRVLEAFEGLDLLVALEYYLTPSTAYADYVLPVAGAMERASFQAHGGVANIAYGGPAAVLPQHERRTDYAIFRALGLRMGQDPVCWPNETLEDEIAVTLASAGMSWEQYVATGVYAPPASERSFELPDENGEPRGFGTPSGKIELASSVLEQLGGNRLPTPSAIALAAADDEVATIDAPASELGVPLTLLTGVRKQPYNASMYHDIAAFRKMYPRPLAEMSAATAARLGLERGDEIEIVTERGSATFSLDIITMRDDVVSADYGWWDPSSSLAAPHLGGIFESNINTVTDCSRYSGEGLIGTWSYNRIRCSIRKKS